MFMPMMFSDVPVGAERLVLYWTVSNLWAIGQQTLTNKLIGPPPQRTRAAGRRAAVEECGRRQERRGAKERK